MKSIAIVGYIAITLLVLSNVALSQLLQAVLKDWGQRWNCVYVVRSGFALAFLAYWALKKYRERQGIYIDLPVRFLALCAFLICFVGTGTSITWYFSLQLTTVSANNAVYQSVSVLVFILSVLLLGEKITFKKIISVAFSIGGALLVSFNSQKDDGEERTNTPMGFFWVFMSALFYASYEIFYSAGTDIHFTRNYVPGFESKDGKYLPVSITEEGNGDDKSLMANDELKNHSDEVNITGNDKTDASEKKSFLHNMYFGTPGEDTSKLAHNYSESSPLIVCCTRFRKWESRLKGWGSRAYEYLEQGAPLANVPLSPMMKVEMAAYMLGMVGLATMLFQWPFFFVVEATGFEQFKLPSKHTAILLFLAVIVDVIFNLCLLIGIGATSPLVMAIGGIMCVPTAIISDVIIHGTVITPLAGLGVVFIVFAFLCTQVDFEWLKRKLFSSSKN